MAAAIFSDVFTSNPTDFRLSTCPVAERDFVRMTGDDDCSEDEAEAVAAATATAAAAVAAISSVETLLVFHSPTGAARNTAISMGDSDWPS